MPAASAGPPRVTVVTRVPVARAMPSSAAMAGPNLASRLTPRKARVTLPVSINCRATAMKRLMGIEKPMPSLPPELLAMAVLMPMISPRRLHKRAAAVAGIDGRVGLQKVLEADRVVAQLKIVPPAGADDAERDRVAQAEGAADGQHEVADLHPIAVADRGGDQIGRLDGQHADVGLFVLQHPLRMKPPAVGQVDANAVGRGVAKDVPVGEHVEAALPLDDHARAGFLDVPVAIVLERLLRHVGFDMDHRRADELGHGLDDRGLGLQHGRRSARGSAAIGPALRAT